jgi:hypothetical protein
MDRRSSTLPRASRPLLKSSSGRPAMTARGRRHRASRPGSSPNRSRKPRSQVWRPRPDSGKCGEERKRQDGC